MRGVSPRFSVAVVLLLLAALLATAAAQPPEKVARVGFLSARLSSDSTAFLDPFRQRLQELGWVEGKNLVFEPRWAEGRLDRLPALADELVRLKVDVIVVSATQPAVAARGATRTIPIVMAMSGDPVGLGLVASLARPGGNVTGLSYSVGLETISKGLELLKEVVPRLRRVAALINPAHPSHALVTEQVRVGARAAGVELQVLGARDLKELDGAFAAMARERVQALLVAPDPTFALHRARIHDLAARGRLPAWYGLREHTATGGLMSYDPDLRENFRRAATYVDRILKGARPADLPVEQPTKFDLVVNLKTAKALGLTIPQSILLRAEQIIE